MAYTDVILCNMALAKLGDEAAVTSISPVDGSVQSSLCATFYPVARNALLDMHVWNFATKEVVLTTTTNNRTSWDYAYTLPADFMGIVDVREASYYDIHQTPNTQNYSLENGVLYSNIVDAVLLYSSTTATDPALFQPLFGEALATLLAYYLAGPIIKGDVGVAAEKNLLQAFAIALKAAKESDSAYRKIRPSYTPTAIYSRA